MCNKPPNWPACGLESKIKVFTLWFGVVCNTPLQVRPPTMRQKQSQSTFQNYDSWCQTLGVTEQVDSIRMFFKDRDHLRSYSFQLFPHVCGAFKIVESIYVVYLNAWKSIFNIFFQEREILGSCKDAMEHDNWQRFGHSCSICNSF